jgi:hypothetical protein
LSNVGLTIDQPSALAELHEMPKAETKEGTVDDRENYLDWWIRKTRLDEITKMNCDGREQLT